MYDAIYQFRNLRYGFYAANRGKLGNPTANKFEIRLLEALILLSDQLQNKQYKVGQTTKFKVYYPKERDIETSPFKDKVVQHSLCDNVLYKVIEPSFIYDNCASQVNKGRSLGAQRLKRHLQNYFFSRKAAHEKYLKENGLPRIHVEDGHYADGWVLKCDIRKYFAHINHDLLIDILRGYFQEEDIIALMKTILDSTPNPGIPIGFQTSPLLALLLLNEFDHMVKEKLKIKYYGRYADDFYLIHENKEYLKKCLKDIKDYLGTLGLELNEKTQIFPIKNGLDYLGFHTYITDTGRVIQKLRKRTKENARRRLKQFRKKYDSGTISASKIQEFYQSWRAYASQGDTYHLIKRMDAFYDKLFPEFLQQTLGGDKSNVLY